ncbi:VENN motif pre-toxin domain-containing protein [Neisseria animalis]|uniref:Toxin CdiA n=1 Tax=Neisseria animalis TaxID=492 RepID=A0A5P3MTA7_NEIAN|nr:VENN motif pre-toxin domain-containing protein [Neisseria animalis]QEY24856.1 hypothetical protein D0T90_10545 [Neisseria animalis]ROW31399.1 hypothetical protein CGZ60_10510 [Neisseria animalis]VEE08015.1 putative hemagglutinin [Neisseria animalis]
MKPKIHTFYGLCHSCLLKNLNRPEEGSKEHIALHILNGVLSGAAADNNALLSGLSAGGAELAAPALAQILYNKDTKELSVEEKSSVSALVGLYGSAVGAASGNTADVVQSGQVAQNAVENNDYLLQAIFIFKHPIIAAQIGSASKNPASELDPNISTIASTFQINLLKEVVSQEDLVREGGIGNTYRHALWQAIITKKFGENIAKEAGNAHESRNGTDYSNFDNLPLNKADELVDQLNNKIGRDIALQYPNISNKKLAEKVLYHFSTEGLYQATKGKNGKYKVERKILDKKHYQASKDNLRVLDDTGAGKKIQQRRKELNNNIKKGVGSVIR